VATYVLVHGAWHGAWCWEKLTPLLESEGHTVVTPDLPGRGDAPAPASEMTLAANAERVREHLERADEPVILVGHSMGGMAVTQAAELAPEKVAKLVYLAAFLAADGQSLFDLAAGDDPDFVQQNLIVDEAGGTCRIADEAIRQAFYGECGDDDVERASRRLVPESLAAMAAPVRTSDAGWGSIPRIYVECLRDGAIDLPRQRRMQAALPCDEVHSIDTDHSPFVSRTDELAAILLGLA